MSAAAKKALTANLARAKATTFGTYVRPDFQLVHGSRCRLTDSTGKSYLDLSAGIAVCSLGHADPGLAKVIGQQAAKLVHVSNIFNHPAAGEASAMICDLTRKHGGIGFSSSQNSDSSQDENALKVFFTNSGTEANEGAIKLCRAIGKKTNERKTSLVSFNGGFHGRSMGALSATSKPMYQAPFLPLIPGFSYGEINNISALQTLITEETCGVLIEPIQGEGGIHECSPEFLRTVRERCNQVGAVLVYDEIQCGLWRTGSMWAHSDMPVDCHPDVITMAKPLANGFPIGAILAKDKFASVLTPGTHGTTFGGSPLACSAAVYVLGRLSAIELQQNVQQSGSHLKKAIAELTADFTDLITQSPVRGRGLILGFQLKHADWPNQVVTACSENGLIILTAGDNTIRIVPPLIITTQEIDEAMEIIRKSLLQIRQSQSKDQII